MLARWTSRPAGARRGGTPEGDARRLVEVERSAGESPPAGCEWLDDATIDDLGLARVFARLDRTQTPVGAQQLWRLLAAPALELDVLGERERALAQLAADPELRARLGAALAPMA